MLSAIFEQIVNGIVSGSVYAIVAVGTKSRTELLPALRASRNRPRTYVVLPDPAAPESNRTAPV